MHRIEAAIDCLEPLLNACDCVVQARSSVHEVRSTTSVSREVPGIRPGTSCFLAARPRRAADARVVEQCIGAAAAREHTQLDELVGADDASAGNATRI